MHRPAARTTAARYLSCLRPLEILVLQGAPLLGAIVALGPDAVREAGSLALLVAGNLCLVAHVFLINDWSNADADRTDPNRATQVFTARGVAPREMAGIAVIVLLGGLLSFLPLGAGTARIALGIAALSALYSLPRFDWKGRPLLNSAAHLVGGVLHFLLGYSIGRPIDGRGLLLGAFFAVTFTAGHLTQEIRDYPIDVRNGVRTNAVAFGVRATFVASLALFTLSHALLATLALVDVLPRALVALALLYPLHLWWWVQTLRRGLSHASICRLQARYRLLYASIGLAMVAAIVAR